MIFFYLGYWWFTRGRPYVQRLAIGLSVEVIRITAALILFPPDRAFPAPGNIVLNYVLHLAAVAAFLAVVHFGGKLLRGRAGKNPVLRQNKKVALSANSEPDTFQTIAAPRVPKQRVKKPFRSKTFFTLLTSCIACIVGGSIAVASFTELRERHEDAESRRNWGAPQNWTDAQVGEAHDQRSTPKPTDDTGQGAGTNLDAGSGSANTMRGGTSEEEYLNAFRQATAFRPGDFDAESPVGAYKLWEQPEINTLGKLPWLKIAKSPTGSLSATFPRLQNIAEVIWFTSTPYEIMKNRLMGTGPQIGKYNMEGYFPTEGEIITYLKDGNMDDRAIPFLVGATSQLDLEERARFMADRFEKERRMIQSNQGLGGLLTVFFTTGIPAAFFAACLAHWLAFRDRR